MAAPKPTQAPNEPPLTITPDLNVNALQLLAWLEWRERAFTHTGHYSEAAGCRDLAVRVRRSVEKRAKAS